MPDEENLIAHLGPEFVYAEGTEVPSKNLNYKLERDSKDLLEPVRAWYKQKVRSYEARLRSDIGKEVIGSTDFPTFQEVHIGITFGVHDQTRYKEIDIDNRTKTILDAMVGPIYEDDCQVKKLSVEKKLTDTETDWCLFAVKILK